MIKETTEVIEKWIVRVEKTVFDYYEIKVDDEVRKDYEMEVGEDPRDYLGDCGLMELVDENGYKEALESYVQYCAVEDCTQDLSGHSPRE
jgi:hypothetical protein